MTMQLHQRNGKAKTGFPGAAPRELGQYHAVVQQLLSLRTDSEGPGIAIGVTGGKAGEGVTITALNLAMSAAAGRHETLLLDANTARPELSRKLGAKRNAGWCDVLTGHAELPDCFCETTTQGLTLLPTKVAASADIVTFVTDSMADLLNTLRDRFSLVIVDLPPAFELGTCCHLVRHLDGVLLVVDSEKATQRNIALARKQLVQAQANVLGAILNRQKSYVPRWLGGRA